MKIRPEWSQRLLRKGVLVQETYELFAAWDDGLSVADNLKSALSGRHKTAGWEREVNVTLKRRLRDVESVRPLIALAKRGMSLVDWRDCLRLWIGAAEQPFHDFATGWLFDEHGKGRYQIRSEDVRPFIGKAAAARGPKAKPLSEYGQLRSARDLLRMAVDLGMLAGDGPTKTFASIAMSDDVTMFYVHMISDLESNTTKMLSSRLWRLAYMAPTDVHVALLRLHQYKRLNYEVAGNIAQVGLPFKSALECAERGCGMTDFEKRLRNDLEPHLAAADPRAKISAYHDMPYALFRYDPEQEYPLRRELTMLTTRLTQKGKRVTRISLAECLSEAMTSQRPLEDWYEAERSGTVEETVQTITNLLEEYAPLVDLVAARMPSDPDPKKDVVLIFRTGALFPVYRTFSLLEQLKGRVHVPTILFYPGDLDGASGLRFMSELDAEHNYRPKIF